MFLRAARDIEPFEELTQFYCDSAMVRLSMSSVRLDVVHNLCMMDMMVYDGTWVCLKQGTPNSLDHVFIFLTRHIFVQPHLGGSTKGAYSAWYSTATVSR